MVNPTFKRLNSDYMKLYVEDLIIYAENELNDSPRARICIVDEDVARYKEINRIRVNKKEEVIYIDISE